MPINQAQRYTKVRPCPVCNGYEAQTRGYGLRCTGFLSDDGNWGRCSREEHADGLQLEVQTNCYVHHLVGACNCGATHSQSAPMANATNTSGKQSPRPKLIETAVYDYLDTNGVLRYQVVRKEPVPQTEPPVKDFLQRHPCPDKNGDMVWNLGGNSVECSCPKIDRLLYRLPELIAADPDATVYIVEGEKDVEKLRASGLVATCNSGGARKWEPKYSENLLDRKVVVLPDNDKNGIDQGQQVAQSLHGKAKTVKILDLPDLPKKGDVSDWLDGGGTVKKFQRLVEQVEEWEPSVPIEDNSVNSVNSVQGWGIPQPLVTVEVPIFPVGALPMDIAEYVRQEAEAKQVPIDLPGCLVLGAMAAAVAAKAKVSLSDDWTEPLNNFFVVVLPSGERKSPVVREIFLPMEEYEKALVVEQTPSMLNAKTERDILEKRLHSMKVEAAKSNSENSVIAEADARTLAVELAKVEVPSLPRILADDATPEAVAGLLAEQHGRIAIVSTEGGIFDIIGGRYSDKSPNLDVYLKAYSGDAVRVDRRSRPPEYIADPALTVVITVQPHVIRDLANTAAFLGRGFLARFNFAMPGSNVGYRKINAATVQAGVRGKWKEVFTAALKLPYPPDNSISSIHLSSGAKEKFQAFRSVVETGLRPGGELDDIADWGNKLCGNVARLAGLLHAIQYAGKSNPWEFPISPKVMSDAISLGKYFMGHAKAAFAAIGADPRLSAAGKVWAVIVRQHMKVFSVRDLYRLVRNSFKTVGRLEETLALLVELDYIRELPNPKRDGAGQPASRKYEVNPLVPGQNCQNCQNSGIPEPEADSDDEKPGDSAHQVDVEDEVRV